MPVSWNVTRRPRGEPHPEDVARVLERVEAAGEPCRPPRHRRERAAPSGVRSPFGATTSTSSFGSSGSRIGVGCARAAWTFSIPKPLAGSRPGWSRSRAVRRSTSETWPGVELGSGRPDPGGRAGDERRREARAGARPPVLAERAGDGDVGARRCEVDVRRAAREAATAPERSVAATVSTCGRTAGYPSGLPRVAVVPGGGDDERARRDRLRDRLLDRRVSLATEAEIDHAAPGARRLEDARRRSPRLEPRALAARGVPGAQDGLRVDADDARPLAGAPTSDATAVPCSPPIRRAPAG